MPPGLKGLMTCQEDGKVSGTRKCSEFNPYMARACVTLNFFFFFQNSFLGM